MASDQTRTAILAAAERLYADRGFGDVTLRDIVAEANVNLAAVNYHFGSKDELIAELFVTRSLALNRERLAELKAPEEAGGGPAPIGAVLRALGGPTRRRCLRSDNQRSTPAGLLLPVPIESSPPSRRRRGSASPRPARMGRRSGASSVGNARCGRCAARQEPAGGAGDRCSRRSPAACPRSRARPLRRPGSARLGGCLPLSRCRGH